MITSLFTTPSQSAQDALSPTNRIRRTAPTINLICRGCDFQQCDAKGVNGVKGLAGLANITMSYYPQKRGSSPGSRKLQIPARSSTGTFASDPYAGYSRSPVRENYASPRSSVSGGVIPISTETYVTYPDSPSSRTAGSLSGRPRRSTMTETSPTSLTVRPRPTTVLQDGAVDRPRSPLPRGYDREVYVKPAQAPKREQTRLYSVGDNKSAQLIAETETDPRDSRYFDTERESGRERHGYHLTGSNRPRDIDDGAYSYYSDPAVMYQDTEPRWRRRDSVDRTPRSADISDPYPAFGPPARSSTLREGPPPTTRGLDKVNDIVRTGSIRDPPRANSKERRNTYDPYRNGDSYEIPRRSSSATREPVIINVQRPDDRFYRDDEDDKREPRNMERFRDVQVESRGFGIRSVSSDPPRDYEQRQMSYDNRAPPPVGAYGSGIVSSPTTLAPVMPDPKDYMPPPPAEARHSTRDEGRHGSYDEGRHRTYDEGRHGSYDEARHGSYDEGRRTSKDPVYERVDRERDRERERERDRDFDRRRDDRQRDSISTAAPAVTTGAAGVAAGAAAVAAVDRARRERDIDKRRHDSDEEEHRHGVRTGNPNDREDARELEYSERDRREEEARKRDRYKDPNVLDPDEEYRRRVEQAQLELARQTSRESQKSDDEGRRKLRKERPRDKESGQSGSGDEGAIMPSRELVRRDRASSLKDDNNTLNRPSGTEAEALAGAAAAAATSTALVVPGSFADDGSKRKDSVSNGSSDEDGSHGKKARGVRIVEPAKATTPPPPPIKSILKKPKEKFPEDPNPIKEGALPLPNSRTARDKSIPPGARWTKISRELVNPEALDQAKLRYEERLDCVIVLRVLTKKEIEDLAALTRRIRGECPFFFFFFLGHGLGCATADAVVCRGTVRARGARPRAPARQGPRSRAR